MHGNKTSVYENRGPSSYSSHNHTSNNNNSNNSNYDNCLRKNENLTCKYYSSNSNNHNNDGNGFRSYRHNYHNHRHHHNNDNNNTNNDNNHTYNNVKYNNDHNNSNNTSNINNHNHNYNHNHNHFDKYSLCNNSNNNNYNYNRDHKNQINTYKSDNNNDIDINKMENSNNNMINNKSKTKHDNNADVACNTNKTRYSQQKIVDVSALTVQDLWNYSTFDPEVFSFLLEKILNISDAGHPSAGNNDSNKQVCVSVYWGQATTATTTSSVRENGSRNQEMPKKENSHMLKSATWSDIDDEFGNKNGRIERLGSKVEKNKPLKR
eukprot:Pgem_evm1s3196